MNCKTRAEKAGLSFVIIVFPQVWPFIRSFLRLGHSDCLFAMTLLSSTSDSDY